MSSNQERAKVILVILDGLRWDVATTQMGYLEGLIEEKQGARYKVLANLPTLSRTNYEAIMTGTPSYQNGIVSNAVVRLTHQESIFHLCRKNDLVTAAAAFCWVSELYNRAPFDPLYDREQHDETKAIQHGVFYFEDAYPDSHLLLDAERLRRDWDPDFLLIHPMGLDDIGHKFGGESAEYKLKAIEVDSMIASHLPRWLEDGNTTVIVTSDHGMNANKTHGGVTPDVREVPLYMFGPQIKPGIYEEVIAQYAIAPTVCRLLGIDPASNMRVRSFL